MSKLGDALGGISLGGMGGSDDASASDEAPASSEMEPKTKGDSGSAELMAMKMFDRASTPEARVSALKAFLEACGAIGSDY